MAKISYREALQRASSLLGAKGLEPESMLYVFLRRKQWDTTQWLLHFSEEIPPADQAQLAADLEALLAFRPAQYLLGYEEFCGHRFKVTEATLIPRPETEELVMAAIDSFPPDQSVRVADIGTGTGAIGLSVKLARPQWQVALTDLSQEALAVAKENAELLGTQVAFYQGDTLEALPPGDVDLLLSNPPYISVAEWDLMDESVRRYEPKTALFAEDEGLAIYRKLAQQAPARLTKDGQVFLEIGFAQGKAVQEMFQEAFPEKEVAILKDLAGQDRIVHVF
ncbi:protein-(glutamine-N5) methyltransferase, release factor-specific [Enterococcus asini ATCC 700915]|uniref:Release factor glutamine methyltransferase n=1 Tax=Enterococcus asini ATCC 700915 TaxID=1158606 RepID=R2S4K2_9ENTE|nr:peptide chain release factor N(5)-glutamine methyltransferase [Enterococcus asini]EOH90430.1 protein-(glutamine-N5) methyltransferase, release factor-specific [Enterococcus asini ATCC 700915]EOT56938.1 protein-(glutamine-N5) methyltransferase, release factor-specific [Enterococcus asini ATCC 700915]